MDADGREEICESAKSGNVRPPLVRLPAEDVPLAALMDRKGRLMIKTPLAKETIRKAIREERDSR
jgi:hypothetical protein